MSRGFLGNFKKFSTETPLNPLHLRLMTLTGVAESVKMLTMVRNRLLNRELRQPHTGKYRLNLTKVKSNAKDGRVVPFFIDLNGVFSTKNAGEW